MRRAVRAIPLVAFLLIASLSACAPVSGVGRGQLAKPHMAPDAHPMQRELRDHVYASREAAAGGHSAGGGGCGCN